MRFYCGKRKVCHLGELKGGDDDEYDRNQGYKMIRISKNERIVGVKFSTGFVNDYEKADHFQFIFARRKDFQRS